MYCPNCGQKIKERDNYCTNCGKEVDKMKTQTKEEKSNQTKTNKANQGGSSRKLWFRVFDVVLVLFILFSSVIAVDEVYMNKEPQKELDAENSTLSCSGGKIYEMDRVLSIVSREEFPINIWNTLRFGNKLNDYQRNIVSNKLCDGSSFVIDRNFKTSGSWWIVIGYSTLFIALILVAAIIVRQSAYYIFGKKESLLN